MCSFSSLFLCFLACLCISLPLLSLSSFFWGWIAGFGNQLFSWAVCYVPLWAAAMVSSHWSVAGRVHSVGLWPFLWLSVTSSCELGQPKLQALLTMACDALDCAVYCSEAIACNSPFLLGPCWTQISCSFSAIRWFPFYFSAFCTAFIFLFLRSSYGKFGTLLSLFMVRDCKMQILRSKTSPLSSSCSQWFPWGTYILPSVLAMYYYFMPSTFLCHALLSWQVC